MQELFGSATDSEGPPGAGDAGDREAPGTSAGAAAHEDMQEDADVPPARRFRSGLHDDCFDSESEPRGDTGGDT